MNADGVCLFCGRPIVIQGADLILCLEHKVWVREAKSHPSECSCLACQWLRGDLPDPRQRYREKVWAFALPKAQPA